MFAEGEDFGFRRGKLKTCGFPKIPHRTRIRNAIPDITNEVVVVCVVHNVKRLMKKASRSESVNSFFLGSGDHPMEVKLKQRIERQNVGFEISSQIVLTSSFVRVLESCPRECALLEKKEQGEDSDPCFVCLVLRCFEKQRKEIFEVDSTGSFPCRTETDARREGNQSVVEEEHSVHRAAPSVPARVS